MHKETLLLIIAFLFFIGILFLIFFLPQRIEQSTQNKKSFDMAMEKNDPKHCDEIKGNYYPECPELAECLIINKYSCYYQLALKNKNSALCENAGEFKEECLNKLNQNAAAR